MSCYFLSLLLPLLAALGAANGAVVSRVQCDTSIEGDIYGFSARLLNETVGNNVNFDQFQGQVVMFVNLATYNERTTESYLQLNELMSLYTGQPFTILGFPNNQFNREEPGATATEIYNAITLVNPGNGFIPNFLIFQKADVNGESEDTIFTFLKSGCSYTDEEFNIAEELVYSPVRASDIRSPFEKFLVDKNGVAHYRYHASLSSAQDLTADIDELLSA